MPLFGSKPADGAGAWEPQAAAGRLARTAGAAPSGVFTSDLSSPPDRYVLLGEAGFEPLGFVVGSSSSTTLACRSDDGRRIRNCRS